MTKRYIETDEEVLKVNARTGEILLAASKNDSNMIKETKLQAYKLLSRNDFVNINGVWEAKRDALIKILSSLPISYSWKILDKQLTKEYAQVMGVLKIETGSIVRQADSMGICEFSELKGNGGLHFMNARAETRALKRAIETLFGSVINFYILNVLEAR
jgi:predicted enzyme involved in methoxymalonyl-ACP biosynthesis